MAHFWNRIRKAKGLFERMQSVLPREHRPDWNNFSFEEYSRRFDDYCNKYPKVKSALLTIAGQVVADGVFTSIEEEYPRAVEAKKVCDQFNKRVGMYLLVRKTALRMAKYGTAFWELDFNDVNGLNVQLIPHQEYMKPVFVGGEITGWNYELHHQVLHKWSKEQICVFPLDPEENDPYGTSLLTGIDRELATQDEISSNLLTYLRKQAWASNVLQVGDASIQPDDALISAINTEVKNRKVGEDFVTSYPIELKVMGAAQVETRMIPDTLKFSDDQVTDALMIPPISKLYNSTEASATVMTDWSRANLITPIQSIIAEVVEKQVYQPMLEDLGFTAKLTPALMFDPPDVHTNDEAQYWGTLLDKKVQTPEQVCKALGLKYDSAYWKQEEAKQLEQQQMQLEAKQANNEQTQQETKPEQPTAKESWIVTKLKPQVQELQHVH